MPTNCLIHFDDNPSKVYYAGQLLSGRVELSFTDTKTLRGIYVEISGKAYCRWSEGSRSNKTYTGQESYLAERTYFIGGRGSGEMEVSAGQYQYNFQCNLPAGLPTSLEAEFGHIRYRVRVVLDIPLWLDDTFYENFTVIKPLNLNDDRTMRLPAFEEVYKRFFPFCFCCCCPSPSPMHLIARIPVSGYTPGQTINIEIYIDNKSTLEAIIGVQLIKSITYYISANSSKQHKESKKIGVQPSVGISRPHSVDSFRVAVVVPPTPPTDETTSNICKVRYLLRVIAAVSWHHVDPFVDIPITIGSYPILDNLNLTSYTTEASKSINFTPEVMPQLLPHVPSASGAGPSAPLAPYLGDDPPTYEQASEDNDVAGNSFRPNYPVYRRATSYSSASKEKE